MEIHVIGHPRIAHGITFNVSRSGMLAHLDRVVEVGDECTVQFPSPSSEPGQTAKGCVVGMRQGAGVTMAAFMFETPVELDRLLEVLRNRD